MLGKKRLYGRRSWNGQRQTVAAAVLCTVMVLGMTPASNADPVSQQDIEQSRAEAAAASQDVAKLANQLSSSESELADLNNQLGGLRETGNQAIAKLNAATEEADAAQAKVVEARGRLDHSQSQISQAQQKLDDIARAAYNQGASSAPVTLAAGENSVADTLDRASYLRTASEKQKAVVDSLDRARTDAANTESQLRDLRNEADKKRAAAKDEKDRTMEAIRSAAGKIRDIQLKIQEIQNAREAAEGRLNAAKQRTEDLEAEKRAQERAEAEAKAKAAAEAAAAENAAQAEAASQANASSDTSNGEAAGDSASTASAAPSSAAATAPQAKTHNANLDEIDSLVAERQKAAAEAKEKTDAAVAVAEAARNKELVNADDADKAREEAADKTEHAAEAVKRVEDLTAKLQDATGDVDTNRTGNGAQGSSNIGSSSTSELNRMAIQGLTSSALSALVAGVRAKSADDPDAVGKALAAGNEAAKASYSAIVKYQKEQAEKQSQLAAAADTAVATTESEPSDSKSKDNNSKQSDDSTDSTGTLVTGLKNTSDSLERIEDGTDSTSVSATIGGTTTAMTTDADSSVVAASGSAEKRIEAVIARAKSQLGVTYAWGGGNAYGPTRGIRDGGVADSYGDYNRIGFDCSGLVVYAFHAAGISLVHYSGAQYTAGTQYPASQMKRGDLIFYGPGGAHHVAIYLGNGQMIEAPQSGDVVKISPVRYGGMTPMVTRLIS